MGRFDDAVTALGRSIDIRRGILRVDPQNARIRELLQADEAKLPGLVDAIRKAGGSRAVVERAQALQNRH
jgi:hypothetical protein